MRIRYTKEAAAQLALIAEHTAALYGKRVARTLGSQLRILIEQEIPVFPHRGREGVVSGTRELAVRRPPCRIVYRLTDGQIEILVVLQQEQEWPRKLGLRKSVLSILREST